MVSANKVQGIPIAPRSMVDSVADWPLSQVIAHLKKKESEKVDKSDPQMNRVPCRSTIKSLVDILDSLADRYGASRSQLCRWLSYHGASIAGDDIVLAQLAKTQAQIRGVCLQRDDTDSLDIMNSMIPYAPRVITETHVHLPVYDYWVASDFEDMARSCGVFRYRILQIYMIKSILSDDLTGIEETASRFTAEVARWDSWMRFRLGAMQELVKRVDGIHQQDKI